MALLAAAAAAAPGLAAFADDDDTWPNVFISPAGKPFRARDGAPYPVAAWFAEADANHDGKLDRAEFVADAEAFFKLLDRSKDGVLDNFDVQFYEHRVAPEILGYRVQVGAAAPPRPRLWLAQSPSGMDEAPSSDEDSSSSKPKTLDESKTGAAPYSFFQEPEPITAADFQFNGYITKANFLKLADMHFATLDTHGEGFLTLSGLPKTTAQKELERRPRRRS